jgi:hypothetical protein
VQKSSNFPWYELADRLRREALKRSKGEGGAHGRRTIAIEALEAFLGGLLIGHMDIPIYVYIYTDVQHGTHSPYKRRHPLDR